MLLRDTTKDLGTAATLLDVDIVEYQIEAAQAEVDGRLAGRYKVPFDDPPPALAKSLTIDVAAYLSTLTYRQSKSLEVDDPVRLRYQRALDMLKDISSGVIDLPVTPLPGGGDSPVVSGVATVRNPYVGQLFGPRDFGLGYGPAQRVDGGWRGW